MRPDEILRRTNQINELRQIVEDWDAWLDAMPPEPAIASVAIQKAAEPHFPGKPSQPPAYGDRESAVVEALQLAGEPLTITRIRKDLEDRGYDRTSIGNALRRAEAKGKVRQTGEREGREKLWERTLDASWEVGADALSANVD